MNLSLNRIQRRLCVAAACVIAIVLFIQAQDEGLGETHWIIGSIVVVALLVLASATPRAGGPAKAPVSAPASGSRLPQYDSAYERFLAFIEEAAPQTIETLSGLPASSPLNSVRALLANHFEAAASKAAYMLVFLDAQRRDPDFATSDDQQQLERRAVGRFIHATASDLAQTPTKEPPRSLALKAAAKEFAQCKVAINLSIGAFATSAAAPMDPVYQAIESGLGLAKGKKVSLEAMYGGVAREIWQAAR